jgi:hypothetical protein
MVQKEYRHRDLEKWNSKFIKQGLQKKTSILCAKSMAIAARYNSNRETGHLYRSKDKGRWFCQACHKIKPMERIIYRKPVSNRKEKGGPTKQKISKMISTPSSPRYYCGFAGEKGRINIPEDGFKSFEDIMSLSEKNVNRLACERICRKDGHQRKDRIWLASKKYPKSHCPLDPRLPQDQ